jgi:hypothetical protein
MKFKLLGIVGLFVTLLWGTNVAAVAKEPPVAKLIEVEGLVEYSRNGSTWRPVRRTKYLFAGYQIRTGKNGSGDLVNQETGDLQELGSNSHIKVGAEKVTLIAGSLSEPKSQSEGIFSIFQGLANKFAKAQRYTTVRRGVSKDEGCNPKVRTIKNLTLSQDHPELVWRNACPEYSYRLVVDDSIHQVPAQSTAEMIRFEVDGIKSGTHTYRVEVLDIDGVVYIPKSDSGFNWMSNKEAKALRKQAKMTGDDIFVLASLLESNNLHVAVMDTYREYFNENPDDNDMRPLLIKAYNDLKLTNLKNSEARLYNASLEEDY